MTQKFPNLTLAEQTIRLLYPGVVVDVESAAGPGEGDVQGFVDHVQLVLEFVTQFAVFLRFAFQLISISIICQNYWVSVGINALGGINQNYCALLGINR